MSSRTRASARLTMAATGALAVALALATATPRAQQARSATPAAAPAQTTARVERFLVDLQKARTTAEAAALLKAAQFTDQELAALDRELAKPAWSPKVTTLSRSVTRTTPSKPTLNKYAGKSASSVVDESRQMVARAHRLRVDQSQAAAGKRLPSPGMRATPAKPFPARPGMTARPPGSPSAPAGSTRPTAPLPQARATASAGREWPARITDLEPNAATAGQLITIVGSGFGSDRGAVAFKVGELLLDAPEIGSWTPTRITARVPDDLLPWHTVADVPDDVVQRGRLPLGRDGEVWIRLHDGQWGAWLPVLVAVEAERFAPSITAVTPDEATPEGHLLIEGTNFGEESELNSASRRLSLGFGRTQIELRADEWHDGYISARVDRNVTGIGPLSGLTLQVTNKLRMDARRAGLSFVPAEDVQDIELRTAVAMCHPAGHPLFCWVGDSNTITVFDRELRNGWTVERSWLETDVTGVNAGAYFEVEPRQGDTRALMRITVWADGLSRAECTPHLVIKGPRGTSWR